MVTQLGGRLACSRPLAPEKFLHIESGGTLQHIIDGPSQFMRQDRQGLALAVSGLEAGQILLARRIVAEEQDRRFGESPLEIGVADLGAGGPIAFPGRFFGTCDQAAIGDEILHPWEAGDGMNFLQEPATENLADARNGLEQIQGIGVMLLGRRDNGQLQITE